MDAITKLNSIKSRTKSDMSSSAQSIEMLQAVSESEALYKRFLLWSSRDRVYSVAVKAMVSLLFEYGLRVSEVCNIRAQNIMHDGRILIKASKGSLDRFIVPRSYISFWKQSPIKVESQIRCYSRFYIYRLMKSQGLAIRVSGHKTDRVTHCARVLHADSLRKQNVPRETIAQELGHKNKKNVEYYLKPYEKKC